MCTIIIIEKGKSVYGSDMMFDIRIGYVELQFTSGFTKAEVSVVLDDGRVNL